MKANPRIPRSGSDHEAWDLIEFYAPTEKRGVDRGRSRFPHVPPRRDIMPSAATLQPLICSIDIDLASRTCQFV
jgi:hypothetical protein